MSLNKPLTLVHDPVKGGATVEFIKTEECPTDLVSIFDGREIITWHRIKEVRIASCVVLRSTTYQLSCTTHSTARVPPCVACRSSRPSA